MRIRQRHLAVAFTLSVVTFGSGTVFGQADGIEFFESKVRPALATHCISCHGPKAQKGGLRLDSREALLRGGESGPVIVEGDPESSLLVDAIAYESAPKMPPKGKLTADVLDDLKEWVKQGAPWPESSPTTQEQEKAPSGRSWAFRPITNPPYPLVSDAKWPRTSVDWFVLRKLDAAGLKPSKAADRRTLIRRWSYTLIGLPPTPEEVAAFEQDRSPDAEQRVVDRLLASPHYGERWGRHWLDVARYADTKGYVFFEDKEYPWAYTYRDYVVRSLNEDKPYDRFVMEQIAADRLALGDDRRVLAALGFLTVGGRFMNNVQDILDDRIDVTTRGLMGLTVSCARCHDHKFDPIPTADYYALYGVFASSVEPSVPPLLGPPPETEEYRKFEVELKRREAEFETFVASTYHRLIDGAKRRAGEYLLAAHAAKDKPKTDEFMLIADGHDLNPAMIARWRAVLDRTRRQHDPVFAPWHALAALKPGDFPAKSAAILDEMARRGDRGKRINPVLLKALIDSHPGTLNDVADVYERVLNRTEGIWVDAKSRAKLERKKPGPLPDESYEALRKVFHGPDGPPSLPRSAIDELGLFPDRPSQDRYQDLKRAVDTWRATGAGAPPRAMTLVDLPHPIEPKVFVRGNPNTQGPVVPRRFLSALSDVSAEPFDEGSGRLELARAIVDRKNPLTARVLVNRVWMHHFGEPLVDTPGDFGSRSDPPANPELLDHLATAFMNDGWSLKALHRRIALSAAFRQSSDDRPEGRRIDPENRWLWRMNRRRLDWESTRDFLLAIAGRLDPNVGGPAVKEALETGSRRRTLYGAIDRLNVPGLYRSFDFPDPSTTAPQRVETSVPPQALFFMNHPLARESAAGLMAREDVKRQPTTDARLDRSYAVLFGRPPDPRERAALREFLGPNPAEADWQRLAQSLLLCNEFAFID
jgi:cytochrome c553